MLLTDRPRTAKLQKSLAREPYQTGLILRFLPLVLPGAYSQGMAKEKTSISIAPWILEKARAHAEANGLSLSAVIERGLLREITAHHDQMTRAAFYGSPATAGQEADEAAMADDMRLALKDKQGGAAA